MTDRRLFDLEIPRKLITRADAIAQGLPAYNFKPCSACGCAKRLVVTDSCADCGMRVEYKYSIERKYDLPYDLYCEMYYHRDGCCYICARFFTKSMRMMVDHCHTSGMVRGLLCHDCNIRIGHRKEDVIWLMNAAEYLLPRYLANKGLGLTILDEERSDSDSNERLQRAYGRARRRTKRPGPSSP